MAQKQLTWQERDYVRELAVSKFLELKLRVVDPSKGVPTIVATPPRVAIDKNNGDEEARYFAFKDYCDQISLPFGDMNWVLEQVILRSKS